MCRSNTALFSAFVIAIFFTPTAPAAQATAAKLTVVSGNGQLACGGRAASSCATFFPMVVKVTDASGNPIGGKTVLWQIVSYNAVLPVFDTSSVTETDGLAVSRLFQSGQPGAFQNQFLQFVISATVDGLTVNFTETQALTDIGGFQVIFSGIDAPAFDSTLSGPASTKGTVPIRVHIRANGAPVPFVNVRLLNTDAKTSPSASCETGAGADPGSVLADTNGDAVCFPIFGSVPGNGLVSVLVGGLDPAQFDYTSVTPERPLSDPSFFDKYPDHFRLAVTPITPGHVNVVSGNNQSIDPGRASSPLVAEVTDVSGTVTVGNTSLVWTVTPAGAANLSATTNTTDALGRAQVIATLSPAATGQVTVRAALASNGGIFANFILSTNIQISSLAKVSGDLQTAQANQNFAAPLVVQVNGTNGQPLSNQPISFVLNGNATLSVNSALTDAIGRAQTSVKAGSAAGSVTVTAFVANISQAFTLTIIPVGPALNLNSFYNAGGGDRLGALAPCGLVTAIATGLAPNVQGTVLNTNAFGPWANTLATDAVSVNNVSAPIYSVGNVNGVEQVTFQVPCEVAPASSVPITINVGGGTATVTLPVVAATPGIFETVMTDGVRRAVVIRPDGTFVSLLNPARGGDVVRVYVTAMGPALPALVTGALPFAGADSLVLGQVIVGVNNAGARVVSARVSPNQIGVFEVAFQVPSDAPTANDVPLNVVVNTPGSTVSSYSNGSKLPVRQ